MTKSLDTDKPKKRRKLLLPHNGATVPASTISDRQLDVLDSLVGRKNWVQPMDIGGRDGSHHSATLVQLAKKGLVERKKLHAIYCYNGVTYRQKLVDNRWVITNGHPPHEGCNCKGSCRYKITPAGRKAIEKMKQGSR